jgi:TrmH family RNA methyltransferase
MKYINSKDNLLVRELKALKNKSRERKKKNKFIIEGEKEIFHAINGGYSIQKFFTTEKFKDQILEKINVRKKVLNYELIILKKIIFESLCYRSSTSKLIAISKFKNHSINSLAIIKKNPIILILDSPEKPGNIGAVLRTVDASKIDLILISNIKTDIYNPNIIRSSVGCVFNINIGLGTPKEIIHFLKKNKINLYTTFMNRESVSYLKINYKTPVAISFGNENFGLSDNWGFDNSKNIKIPMLGENDSLNLSVSVAIIVYEAIRQRKKCKKLGS